MQFDVDENGCRRLIEEMVGDTRALLGLISEINSRSGLLKNALGDDFTPVDRSVKRMASALEDAVSQMQVIKSCTEEYIARVRQIRITLG